MNTPNNKRKKESQDKITKAFITLLQTKEINEIAITDICKLSKINRSTFYTNYLDIYDLADKVKKIIIDDVINLYPEERENRIHSYNYLKLFQNIKDNQITYKTLFKLNPEIKEFYDFNDIENQSLKYYGTINNIDYHIEFFKAGLNAVIKKWLDNGCKESPEEMNEIIVSEYKNKNINS